MLSDLQFKIQNEALALAEWMIDNDSTLWQLSREFLIPKTTVHRRLTTTLKEVDHEKYEQCRNIMRRHKTVTAGRNSRSRRRA